jgi:hypothetical protein
MSVIQRIRKIVRYNRIAASFVLSAIFIYFAKPTPGSFLIGVPVIFIGEVFRTLSSGYIEKDFSLTMGGPYSVTRNPLYLGNFLMGLGFAIITNQPILLLLFITIFAFIYHVTILEEEKGLLQRYGQEFMAYMSAVPKFLPKLWQWNRNGHAFNWSLVMKHREYITWFGTIGGILLLVAKMTLFGQGWKNYL